MLVLSSSAPSASHMPDMAAGFEICVFLPKFHTSENWALQTAQGLVPSHAHRL